MCSPVGMLTFLLFAALVLACHVSAHTILEEFFCKDANVEYGKSLRGGSAAGLFDTLGKVKNIQECALKCCDHKKCKVAIMTAQNNNCVGVRCFNTSSCETVPARKGEEGLQIAHIARNAQGNVTIDKKTGLQKTRDVDAICPHNEILYNMKLSGGLQAGRFTDIGRVKSIKTCARYCCGNTKDCDLAFMLGKRCYLVKCYSEEKCSPLPASDYSFEQKMAYVSPWSYERNKKIIKVPSGLQKHHLQCTQSKVYENSKLLGGNDAGKYTHVGKVGKMHVCSKMCCEDQDCDVAYMFGKDCFLVKCFDERGCRVIPDETSRKSKSSTFDKQVQYIVKRKFGVKVNSDGKIEEESKKCHLDGEIRNTTVLEKGMLSGHLKTQHGVEKVDQCIKRCCKEPGCHVALMLGNICYSMECSDASACKPKPAPEIIRHQNPVVAFVKRGKISMAP